jgi:hypothetical protein
MTLKTNRASHWTRFKQWLRETDPEGLSNLDGLVALCFITTSLLAVVTLCLKLATLEKPKPTQLYETPAPKVVYADTVIVAPVKQMENQREALETAKIKTERAVREGEND